MRPYGWGMNGVIRIHSITGGWGTDPDDSVVMVGHDGEFVIIQADFTAHGYRTQPFFPDDLAQGRQFHFPIHDPADQVVAFGGDEGNKIGLGLGILNKSLLLRAKVTIIH